MDHSTKSDVEHFIYRIVNTVNGKCYIGRTNQLNKRKTNHFVALKSNTHTNKKLQNAWNKYGGECFKFELLETVTSATSRDREIRLIEQYNSVNNGYNNTTGGDGRFSSDPPVKQQTVKGYSALVTELRAEVENLKRQIKYMEIEQASYHREYENQLESYSNRAQQAWREAGILRARLSKYEVVEDD